VEERNRQVSPYIPLAGLDGEDAPSVRESARTVFDGIADAYDRVRPGYPEALFADLRANALKPGMAVLEVGCGTGQATRQLAEVAREVWCVELGAALAQRARQNLADLGHVGVLIGSFEEIELPVDPFDLVFSATAFHWVDPSVGFKRVASILKPGGSIALATNAHVAGGTQAEILDDVAALQEEIYPEIGPWRFPSSSDVVTSALAGGDIAHVWARIERSFQEPPDVRALFEPPLVRTYEWTATYTTETYLDMLATQSSYIRLDIDRRSRLFDGIAQLIESRLDGAVTKRCLAILAVSTRVGPERH
jgi:SAM-dependent methyltransferase